MADDNFIGPSLPGQDPRQTRSENAQELNRFTDSDSVEGYIRSLSKISSTRGSTNTLVPGNAKSSTNSIMNEYAFISYGGKHLTEGSGGIQNMFYNSNDQPGLLAGFDQWKQPTAKNIIEWSNSISGNAAGPGTLNASDGSTFGGYFSELIANAQNQKDQQNSVNQQLNNLPTAIGNLKYEWKDFAFLKHFGQIPNNRLITLRRYKLPVLDSGAVLGRKTLLEEIESYGRPEEEYFTSDSARALTYFGEGTENSINSFLGFSFNLNWDTSFQADLENPEINTSGLVKNVGAEGYGADRFFKALDVRKALPGGALFGEDVISRINSVQGMASQVNANDDLSSFYDLVIQNKAEFEPFSNGWQYRIYGPVNVVTRTSKRKRGLSFNGIDINVTFHYDVHQVDTVNPKLAMLDIISNLLTLTYGDADFYGGDYRFQREPTEFPLPLQLEDHIRRLMSGDDVQYSDIANSFGDYLNGTGTTLRDGEVSLTDTLNTYKSTLKDGLEAIGGISGELIKSAEILAGSIVGVKNSLGATANASSVNNVVNDPFTYLNGKYAGSLATAATNASFLYDEFGKFLTESASVLDGKSVPGEVNSLKATVNSLFNVGSDIKSISDNIISLKPLISGEPVGEWHLTVGNPMNPAMMIGNLLCTNCKLQFGENLGPDDFPTELTATITLTHARDRDKGDIESMFNMGQGRFYVNVDGEPEPWNTGYSSKTSVNAFGSNNGVDGSEGVEVGSGSGNGDEPITITERANNQPNNQTQKRDNDGLQTIEQQAKAQFDAELEAAIGDIEISPMFPANNPKQSTSQTKNNE